MDQNITDICLFRSEDLSGEGGGGAMTSLQPEPLRGQQIETFP